MNETIVMFDMDGTLLDLAFDQFIWNEHLPKHYANQHQCSLEDSQAKLFEYYQKHQHTLQWYSSKFWSQVVGSDVLQLQHQFRHKIQTRSGCHELLQALRQQQHLCWLVTNADCASLELKLQMTGLDEYFQLIISSESIGFPKEHPEFWTTLQQRYPFNPEQAIFIDDTVRVLDSAKRFGIQQLYSISQPSSLEPARDSATLGYPTLQQLPDLLDLFSLNTNKDIHDKTA
ncbi:HAD-IA family hydrolase [Acinetobacter sp. MB5]|uniref:HAD-IA family hydrolase n=1 Tax=Acinetobacter sp. MB5 TaxID=2069438 RepID=UPI000DD0CDE4|nr:HAD-IA family hydrolase [Acinetobacter sp. MB5]